MVETQVHADELAFGPGVERGVRVGAQESISRHSRQHVGDDERKRASDEVVSTSSLGASTDTPNGPANTVSGDDSE
jgi:hypothetical protein